MRSWTAFVAVILLIPLLLVPMAAAEELTVEKLIDEDVIIVGGTATITVKITNPFDQDIPFKIVDENIFGSNGIKVDCLEDVAKANAVSQFKYDPITPYAADNTTLPPAKVTYTDPAGKEVMVESNEVEVTVEESQQQTNVQARGITTIYRCDGQNMQSTSYSQTSQQQKQSQQNQQQMQSMQDEMNQQTEQRLQNQQMAQDTNTLKQEMQKQAQELQEMKQAFADNLGQNEELSKEHQDLLQQGYNMTSFDVDPTNSTSGNFEMQYQTQQGETASLKGSMENNELQELNKESSEDNKRLMEQLQQNEQFQELDKQLRQEGLDQQQPQINQLDNGITEIQVPYKQNETAVMITATIENGTITEVKLERDEEGLTNILAMALLLAIAVTGLLAYNRYFKQQEQVTEIVEKPINYRAEAKKMIKDAERLFAASKQKLAYQRASEAVRFFHSHKMSLRVELSQDAVVDELKERRSPYESTLACLNLCRMVEFAKYTPNKKDFSEIVKTAEGLIK